MERIEIVTQLMAAAIIRSSYGMEFVREDELEHAERIADMVISSDEGYLQEVQQSYDLGRMTC